MLGLGAGRALQRAQQLTEGGLSSNGRGYRSSRVTRLALRNVCCCYRTVAFILRSASSGKAVTPVNGASRVCAGDKYNLLVRTSCSS